ncbi:MAG: 2-oxoglutarate oxidoreductase [bacterium]|jgi:2-oxoglutarate ferredoxin oxidoreductase subunit beta
MEALADSKERCEQIVFDRPDALTSRGYTYCPGCGHGTIHRLVAELIDEFGLKDRTVGMASVGCSVFSYWFFDCDFISCAHGRAMANATGVKRAHPDAFVFTYQGDGDLASIGMAETIHAANRGELITVIFVNNAIYGMTGGQMAPTTLENMVTTTSPLGRDPLLVGHPIRVVEMLSLLEGVAFAARASVSSAKNTLKAKALMKKAFRAQLEKKGFGIIEILSNCNTNWNKSPIEANEWIDAEMVKVFPLGVYKDVFAGEKGKKDE